MSLATHRFVFTTTHGQFHLIDDESYPDPSDVWTAEAIKNRLATTDGFVGIGTLQEDYAEVEIEIVVGERCPKREADAHDHVVECSLAVKSGRLLVSPCMSEDTAETVKVTPGTYRVCVLCFWADAAASGFQLCREHYRIYVWPSKSRAERVIKRRMWDSETRRWTK